MLIMWNESNEYTFFVFAGIFFYVIKLGQMCVLKYNQKNLFVCYLSCRRTQFLPNVNIDPLPPFVRNMKAPSQM